MITFEACWLIDTAYSSRILSRIFASLISRNRIYSLKEPEKRPIAIPFLSQYLLRQSSSVRQRYFHLAFIHTMDVVQSIQVRALLTPSDSAETSGFPVGRQSPEIVPQTSSTDPNVVCTQKGRSSLRPFTVRAGVWPWAPPPRPSYLLLPLPLLLLASFRSHHSETYLFVQPTLLGELPFGLAYTRPPSLHRPELRIVTVPPSLSIPCVPRASERIDCSDVDVWRSVRHACRTFHSAACSPPSTWFSLHTTRLPFSAGYMRTIGKAQVDRTRVLDSPHTSPVFPFSRFLASLCLPSTRVFRALPSVILILACVPVCYFGHPFFF